MEKLPRAESVAVNSTFRFWRTRFTTFQDANRRVYAREIEFRGTPSGADLTGSGTAFASSNESGSGAANAFDNTNADWRSQVTTGEVFIGYDFGSPVEVQQIAWSYGGFATYNPVHTIVEGSDDGVTYNTVWEFDMTSWDYVPRIYTKPVGGEVTFLPTHLIADAPGDGRIYGRRNGAWVALS